jgi:hypothetical protein
MSAMMAEYFSAETVVTQPWERRALWRTRLPPATWKLWVGDYRRGDWVGRWVHNTMPVEEANAYRVSDRLPHGNTQETTFVAGRLFVHAFSSTVEGLTERIDLSKVGIGGLEKLVQVWPVQEAAVVWPGAQITDSEADRLAGVITESFDRIANRLSAWRP